MKKLIIALVSTFILGNIALAGNTNFKVTGTIPANVPITKKYTYRPKNSLKPQKPVVRHKQIQLMHIELTEQGKKALAKRFNKQPVKMLRSAAKESLPSSVANKMNQVPVLDQGAHGSCVTFASTAALDAAYAHGDYISQLCNLEFGAWLEQQNQKYPSGWNGSWNQIVLGQIQEFGIISKDYQEKNGCAGVFEYPVNDTETGNPMSLIDFSRHSENIMADISFDIVLSVEDWGTSDPEDYFPKVKKALAEGQRLAFGTLLDDSQIGVGAVGSYKAANDSWILTPIIEKHAKEGSIRAGHAMVITGYDDNAVVTDSDGKEHKGLFTLRNSWGEEAGDQGNYYMSYDYFKMFLLEAIDIIPHA